MSSEPLNQLNNDNPVNDDKKPILPKKSAISKLTIFILIAMILGLVFGVYFPDLSVQMKPISDGFLRMIKMIIAPLVFSTLVVGIAGHGGLKNLGKIALKTIIYFEIASIIALFIGLFAGHIFQPGVGLNQKATVSSQSLEAFQDIESNAMEGEKAHGKTLPNQEGSVKLKKDTTNPLMNFIEHLIPTSLIDSMASNNILQIVFFAMFFAIAMGTIGDKAKPMVTLLSSIAEIMFKFTEFVMLFAPIGVFAAIASAVGKNGLEVISIYLKLIIALYLSLIIFVVLVRVGSCWFVKISFVQMMLALKDPILLAFTTASSEAALPKAMEIMEKFGVPKNIVSFVMPTGYTFNLDGSALYLPLALLFTVQWSGIHLDWGQQLMIMFSLMVTSKGIAAVPRVSLVVLTATLISFGLPIEGVAVLLGIDHILDMGRTVVNLIGNCVATAIIACWDGSFDYDKMNNFIKHRKDDLQVVYDAINQPKDMFEIEELKH